MKNLLIEGPSGTGKTTLILETLGGKTGKAGGFMTVRLLDDSGQRMGFAVKASAECSGPEKHFGVGDIDDVFIRFDGEKKVDVGAFVRRAGRSLDEEACRDAEFLIMDEFGGVELEDEVFAAKLLCALNREKPVIGVIKSRANAEHTAKGFAGDRSFMPAYDKFRELVAARADTQIITLTASTRDDVKSVICSWMAENRLEEEICGDYMIP